MGSIPGRSHRKISFSRMNFLPLTLTPVSVPLLCYHGNTCRTPVTPLKVPVVQVTAKHAPLTKQCQTGLPLLSHQGNESMHNSSGNAFHMHFSLLSYCRLILGLKIGFAAWELISTKSNIRIKKLKRKKRVGTHQGNESTHNSSGNACPQASVC